MDNNNDDANEFGNVPPPPPNPQHNPRNWIPAGMEEYDSDDDPWERFGVDYWDFHYVGGGSDSDDEFFEPAQAIFAEGARLQAEAAGGARLQAEAAGGARLQAEAAGGARLQAEAAGGPRIPNVEANDGGFDVVGWDRWAEENRFHVVEILVNQMSGISVRATPEDEEVDALDTPCNKFIMRIFKFKYSNFYPSFLQCEYYLL